MRLHKKLALMLANLRKAKPYYCEVEYLESTGTQYIDTGLDYFADFEVGIQLRTNVSNKALGNGAYFCMQRYNASNPYWYFSTGSGASNSYTTSTRITEHHVMKWKDNKIYADDVLLTEFTKDSNTPNRMYLYTTGTSNKYPNVIYFCKLWNPDNGELVRDFIPVLDWDMKPCMYDRVTEQLFYNQATSGDDFSYGREIHYVDYLESTGTQYIDTGITINTSTDEVVSDFQLISTTLYQWIMGEHDNGARFGIGVGDGTNKRNIAYGATTYKVKDAQVYNEKHNFKANSNGVFLDDVQIHGYENFASVSTVYLFKLNLSGAIGAAGKIWYYKHKRNGTLVCDFIPAIDENGVGFMFDRVTHTIYDNVGTGAFGYPAREVEYLYTGDDIATQTSSPFVATSYRLIDTNETIDLSSVVEIKFAFDKNIYFSGCGARNNSSNMTQSIYFPAAYSTLDKFGWTVGSGEEQRQKFDLDTNDHTIKVDLPNATVTWDDVSYPIANLTYTASTRTFPLFAFSDVRATQDNNYRFPMQGKIYYAKFWKNGIATKDFAPCYKDGVACMVDKLTETAYLNQGTGTFTTGKIIEPEYEET